MTFSHLFFSGYSGWSVTGAAWCCPPTTWWCAPCPTSTTWAASSASCAASPSRWTLDTHIWDYYETKFFIPCPFCCKCVQSAVFAVAGGATQVLSAVRPHNPANTGLLTRANKKLIIDMLYRKLIISLIRKHHTMNACLWEETKFPIFVLKHLLSSIAAKVPPAVWSAEAGAVRPSLFSPPRSPEGQTQRILN